jgi:hypothetical protein
MSPTPRPDPEQLLASARRGPALGELLGRYRPYLHLPARAAIGRRLPSRFASVEKLWVRALARLRHALGDAS